MIRTVKRLTKLLVIVGMLVVATTGCGGDELDCSMLGTPTFSTSQTIVSLSQAQKGELCDHEACQVGGYGARLSCSSGPAVTVAKSRSACVTATPSNPDCTATVQELFDCMQAVSANPCTSTLFGDPACAAATAIECLTLTANAPSMTMLQTN
jgi:hypothetical protein